MNSNNINLRKGERWHILNAEEEQSLKDFVLKNNLDMSNYAGILVPLASNSFLSLRDTVVEMENNVYVEACSITKFSAFKKSLKKKAGRFVFTKKHATGLNVYAAPTESNARKLTLKPGEKVLLVNKRELVTFPDPKQTAPFDGHSLQKLLSLLQGKALLVSMIVCKQWWNAVAGSPILSKNIEAAHCEQYYEQLLSLPFRYIFHGASHEEIKELEIFCSTGHCVDPPRVNWEDTDFFARFISSEAQRKQEKALIAAVSTEDGDDSRPEEDDSDDDIDYMEQDSEPEAEDEDNSEDEEKSDGDEEKSDGDEEKSDGDEEKSDEDEENESDDSDNDDSGSGDEAEQKTVKLPTGFAACLMKAYGCTYSEFCFYDRETMLRAGRTTYDIWDIEEAYLSFGSEQTYNTFAICVDPHFPAYGTVLHYVSNWGGFSYMGSSFTQFLQMLVKFCNTKRGILHLRGSGVLTSVQHWIEKTAEKTWNEKFAKNQLVAKKSAKNRESQGEEPPTKKHKH